jgi:tetratricopeptide (TPR) repeat protein
VLIPRTRVRRLLPFRFVVTISILTLALFPPLNCPGQEKPPQTEEQRQAREALNRGVQNFKNGQSEEAISEFARAKQLDPQLLNARLYLATACASLYIPGAPSEENRQKGEAAIAEFRGVLSIQPNFLPAIDGIGSMLFQMAGTPFDRDMMRESKSFHQRHIQISPDDPEPYYWIGVIDWTLAFRANGELRERFNQYVAGRKLSDVQPLPPDLRRQYARDYGPMINEGIQSLQQAMALKPDYDDAMAYLNLLYRRKADTVASEAERDQLTKMADDLIDRIKEIKQKHIDSPPQ